MTRVPATGQRPYRISLPAGSAGTMAARRHVWALIHAWDVPLDAYTAALLTSELVADVLSCDPDAVVELMISWVDRKFCVEVRDASRSEMAGEDPAAAPAGVADAPAGAGAARGGPARGPGDGLLLVVNARRNLHFWYWPGQDR
ncbi:MAG TPA: hypothetical protein VMH35_01785 [Streptosporangiaceae bacterium]|nr:hypothetical protein [Streptosporangiaceae bacterium]